MESWEEINPCVGSPLVWVLGEFTLGNGGGGVDQEVAALGGNVGDEIAIGERVTVVDVEGICCELLASYVTFSFFGQFLETGIFSFPLSLSKVCN